MAKTSKQVRNRQRQAVVAKYRERRAELKALIVSPQSTQEQKDQARAELSRQPRDASATRVRNRDAVDGRPRGYLRTFGISRIRMREMANNGELPGIRKSSW